MANKEKSKYSIDRAYAYLETNYERFDGRIDLVFVVSFGIGTTLLPLLLSGTISPMNTVAEIIFSTSFWVAIICGSLIIRNSGKAKVNQKLTSIETKIDKMGTNIDALIDSQKKLIDHIEPKINALIESQQKLIERIDKLIDKK
jgi:hypothetical protein